MLSFYPEVSVSHLKHQKVIINMIDFFYIIHTSGPDNEQVTTTKQNLFPLS